jgi:pyruvate formate lyase activating enzyme
MRDGASNIIGWIKNSFIDFPGTVSTVLFFSGCNLRCPYCHNPGIVLNSSPEEISFGLIRTFLEKRKGTIEGVVLSGGEPTIHPGLLDIVKGIRALGYLIKLDTNGLRPGVIRAVAPDYLALDVKTLPSNYPALLKSPYVDTPERLAASIEIARLMGDNAEVRITAAPGIIDRMVIIELAALLKGIRNVFLQPMQTRAELLDPAMRERGPIPLSELTAYREILLKQVDRCEIRGEGGNR